MLVDEKRRRAQTFARGGVSLRYIIFIKILLKKYILKYAFSVPTSYPVYLLVFLELLRQAVEIHPRKRVLPCRL